jgi:RNA polymerase sigma factor (sigma-70 family)
VDGEERIQLLTSKGYVDYEQAVLIARVIAGGDDGSRAADLLFRPNHRMLWRFLRAMLRNDDDVDDCLQETEIRVLRKLAGFRGDGTFITWCHGFAKKVAFEFFRKSKRDRQVTGSLGKNDGSDDRDDLVEAGEIKPDPDPSVDPEANARLTQFMNLLKDCQERISRDPDTGQPDPLRQCLTGQWIVAFDTGAKTTGQDVADACGSDVNRAFRALYDLQDCLKSKGVTRESLFGATSYRRKGPSVGERS